MLNILPVDEKVLDFTLKVAESYYGTHQDLTQIPINKTSFKKLHSFNPNTILYKTDDAGHILGWIIVIPTSKELMNKFLEKRITEKELFDSTDFNQKTDALYLCSVFVLPEYRGRGVAKELSLEAIERFSQSEKLELFAWLYSKEGKLLAKNLEQELSRKIFCRV